MTIRTGCCGFPRARAAYFRRFALVEVQQTFYQPPRAATLERWREEGPEGFEFTLKAWQVITHPARSPTYRRLRRPLAHPDEAGFFRPSDTVAEAWARTREAARALGAQVVLFQCPASFTPTKAHIRDMRRFFRETQRDGLAFVWEPRGKWADDVIAGLCAELDLVHGVDPFQRRAVHGAFAYYRLHGIGGYRYRYTDADLENLRKACPAKGDAYCLFNNMSMWEDAARFQSLTGA